jgi:hypothetical protein
MSWEKHDYLPRWGENPQTTLLNFLIDQNKDIFLSKCNEIKYVRIPTIIKLITNGGCLSTNMKLEIGKYVLGRMKEKYPGVFFDKISHVDSRSGETHEIIHYKLENIPELWGICTEWIMIHDKDISYPEN